MPKPDADNLDKISTQDYSLTTIDEDIREIITFQPWFGYDRAHRIFRKFGLAFEEARLDKEIRPLSYFLFGDINSGKTTVVTRFHNIMKSRPDYQKDEIVYLEVPVRATLKQVFAQIYAMFGKVITGSALQRTHTQELVDMIIRELERRKVRLLFIDELQDLLVASRDDKRAIFTGLKKIMNRCSTRLVLIGTTEAKDLLDLDDWIDERLIVIELPPWQDCPEFRRLLMLIHKAYKPFVPDWDLVQVVEDGKPEFNYSTVELLLELSEGRLGKMLQIIKYAIIEALRVGRTNVLEQDYRDIFNNEVYYEITDNSITKKTKAKKKKARKTPKKKKSK